MRTCLRAALTLAAKRDRRIVNRHVWEEDLAVLPNATVARNVVLDGAALAQLVTTAHGYDPGLGLLVHVIAETGSEAVAGRPVGGRRSRHARPGGAAADDAEERQGARPQAGGQDGGAGAGADLARPRRGGSGRSRRWGSSPPRHLLGQTDGQPWGFRRSDQYRLAFCQGGRGRRARSR